MKFISILRKTHIPDEYAVAHLRFSSLILKEKVVLRIHGEPVLWQLCAIPAMLLDNKALPSQAMRPRIGEEAQREVTFRQLANLPCPLHRMDVVHFDCLLHHLRNYAIPLCVQRTECGAGRHISTLLKGCTSLSKISGAWRFPSFGHFDFCFYGCNPLIFNQMSF